MRSFMVFLLLAIFTASPLAAKDLTGTLQQIKESGKIKIGYRHSQPPMSADGKDGIPVGYSIDICADIVTAVKKQIGGDVKIEYVPVTAGSRFDALVDNKIDILCGATTKTLTRSEKVDFTQLTFATGASFMTLQGKGIRNNFGGKKVGVVSDTTTEAALKELFADPDVAAADIVLFKTMSDGLAALEKGEIDALSADQIVLIGLAIATKNPNKFSILPDLFTYEPFALAVRRNDADFRLVADRVISQLNRSKDIRKIYDKWLGAFASSRTSAFDALVELNSISEK